VTLVQYVLMQKEKKQPTNVFPLCLLHNSLEVKPQIQDLRPKIEVVKHPGSMGKSMFACIIAFLKHGRRCRFEVFTAMVMKSIIYWDITPYSSLKVMKM
jgi:hypothetical protein